jgi:hypothetical protein
MFNDNKNSPSAAADEESSLVDKVIEISNLDILKDFDKVIDFIRHKQLSFKAPQ